MNGFTILPILASSIAILWIGSFQGIHLEVNTWSAEPKDSIDRLDRGAWSIPLAMLMENAGWQGNLTEVDAWVCNQAPSLAGLEFFVSELERTFESKLTVIQDPISCAKDADAIQLPCILITRNSMDGRLEPLFAREHVDDGILVFDSVDRLTWRVIPNSS